MEGGSSSLDLPNSAVMASMMPTTSTQSEELDLLRSMRCNINRTGVASAK
jgi:hypothetical protein